MAPLRGQKSPSCKWDTVDERNPAPPGMYKTLLFTVQMDFFGMHVVSHSEQRVPVL